MVRECPNCYELRKALAVALLERDEARHQAGVATDLMMKGEALRDKMMFQVLMNVDEKKEKLAYILTGKKL